MYDQLKTRVAEMIAQPRPIKPQTQRQLSEHMSDHTADLTSFLLSAAEVLEDYELDILFGPQFTPTLEDRAALADLLFHWRPSQAELLQLVHDLCDEVDHAIVELPDLTNAKLTLHEVMAERYVKLLRLNHAPDAATAAALRDALPADLWALAVALTCDRGFTADHQRWFAAFVNHVCEHRAIHAGLLTTIAEFIARQPDLTHDALIEGVQSLLRATKETASQASSGHTYWSPDVAQHHCYRGQGEVDKELVEQRQLELQWVEAMAEDLQSFSG